MSREKQDTISCVPLPHTHSEAMMMTLRPRSTRILLRKRKRRSGRSFAGSADPAQKIKFPLCVTKSPPRRAAAFTFLSLQLSANSGEGCETHLPNLTIVSDTGDPVAVAVGPTFPFTTCRRNVWPLSRRRNFRYRSFTSGEREMRNEWPSKHSELVTKIYECRQRHGMGVTLTKVLPASSPLFSPLL